MKFNCIWVWQCFSYLFEWNLCQNSFNVNEMIFVIYQHLKIKQKTNYRCRFTSKLNLMVYQQKLIDSLVKKIINISIKSKTELKSQTKISLMHKLLLEQNMEWNEVKGQIQKIKQPFLSQVENSKHRLENKIKKAETLKENFQMCEGPVQDLIQKQLENQSNQRKKQSTLTQQSENLDYMPTTNQKLINHEDIEFDSVSQLQKQTQTQPSIVQWQGRDRQQIFKNTSAMNDQFEKIFNKKLPSAQAKKKDSYSYRKDEKFMLQKIFAELKNPAQNNISIEKVYKLFDQCRLFFTVYDINPKDLQDLVISSTHSYPNKLTKNQFLDLFLVNPQKRIHEQVKVKIQKTCCLDQQNWRQLQQLFSQLDTFGCGTVRTKQFFHKMKTVSASKQLLQAHTIYYPNVNRYYPLKKMIFELQNKINLPEKLNWTELQQMIINFSHITNPSIDEILLKKIKSASIDKDSNTFLIKPQTIAILKKEFLRCPSFCESFVKSKHFCDELMNMESINTRKNQLVREGKQGKGFVNLISNIRLIQLKGPEYFDMDEMLIYFSIKGFQQQQNSHHFNISFDTKSTASDEQFQQMKRQELRIKRMKSLDQMKQVMRKSFEQIQNSQRKKGSHQKRGGKFQVFQLTKPKEYMTIREKKVQEMVEEKRLKQQAQIRPFVPSNPLPASMNSQRYQEELLRQQHRRDLQRMRFSKRYEKYEQQLCYLQSTTKLFQDKNKSKADDEKKLLYSSQPKKQFQHKPIEWFVKQRNLLDAIQGQKQERRKNRLKQTREKYEQVYWKNLPYEGNEHQKKEEQSQSKHQDSLEIEMKQLKDKNNENSQHKFKTTIVPDFAKLQKEFMQELQLKKKMRAPTVVKQFHLSVSRKKQNENEQQNLPRKFESTKTPKDHINTRDNTPLIVGKTKKYESMVELIQMKMAQKNYEEELRRLEQKERKKRQKAFAKFMNKVLREQQAKTKRGTSDKSTRRNDTSSRREHESEMRKIYEKVLSRPFLFQSAGKEQKGLRKQGKNSKNQKKEKPKKVKLPPNDVPIEIPPLAYIETEAQVCPVKQQQKVNNPGGEEQGVEFMVNEFEGFDHLQQEESYIEHVIENKARGYKNRQQMYHLNQSF